MRKSIPIFLYLQCLSIIGIDANPLIGKKVELATPGEFPSVVSVATKPADQSSDHVCGGAMISTRLVLTVAHCLEDSGHKIEDLTVTFGSNDMTHDTKRGIESYKTYRQWAKDTGIEPEPFFHDIAIAELDKDVDVEPAKLSKLKPNELKNEQVTAVGWGDTDFINGISKPKKLRKVSAQVIPRKQAEANYEDLGLDSKPYVRNHVFTVGQPPFSFGMGDAGSPIFQNREIVGVNSHAFVPDSLNMKDPNMHMAHVSVHYYLENGFIDFFKKKSEMKASSNDDKGKGIAGTNP